MTSDKQDLLQELRDRAENLIALIKERQKDIGDQTYQLKLEELIAYQASAIASKTASEL